MNLYPFEVDGLTQEQVEDLCHHYAKAETRSRQLRRWFSMELSREFRVTGAQFAPGCPHVTQAPGPRRAHLTFRVPVWFADAICWCRGLR